MSARPRPAPDPESGIALVAVLWGVLLLSVLAVTFGINAGTEARLARNFLANAKARAAADAGVFWAVNELLVPVEQRRVKPNGSTYDIAFADGSLRVTIQDEAGKVDLNAASPTLLAWLLIAAGADPEAGRRIAAAIADWRDADTLRRPDGAERADYEAAGLAYPPMDRPFRLVEELRTVFGVTPPLYEALAPLVTVRSGLDGIDPSVAPAAVLRALPGLDADAVAGIVGRGDDDDVSSAIGTASAEAARFLARSSGAVHMIRVIAVTDTGARFVRTAVVRLGTHPNRPYRFIVWTEG